VGNHAEAARSPGRPGVAKDARVPVTAIARQLGISRQPVYKLLERS